MKDKIKYVKEMIEKNSKPNADEIKIANLNQELIQKENEIQHLKRYYQDLQIRNEYIYQNKIKRKGSTIKLIKLLEKKIAFNLASTDLPVNDYIECYIKLVEYLKGD